MSSRRNAGWAAAEDGAEIGTGPSISHVENGVGLHTVRVTATNGDGKSASASIQIRVQAPPGPIQVQIVSPRDKSFLGYGQYNSTYGQYCQDVEFTSTAGGGSGPLTFNWDDDVTDSSGATIADNKGVAGTQSPVITLCAGNSSDTIYTHSLTLTVSDGKNTDQAFVTVSVGSFHLT